MEPTSSQSDRSDTIESSLPSESDLSLTEDDSAFSEGKPARGHEMIPEAYVDDTDASSDDSQLPNRKRLRSQLYRRVPKKLRKKSILPQVKPTKKVGEVTVKDKFVKWNIAIPELPPFNEQWGLKLAPPPGEEPRSYPDQPPARHNNGQTDPPLWEDRKCRYKKGSRYVRSSTDGHEIDQQKHLLIPLIDMREKSKRDPTPKRLPVYYRYICGIPKDWGDKQAIKALNDRRQQAIDRITMDESWTSFEREHLASLLREYPLISMMELTERFNHHFMGREFNKTTAFSWDELSTGRTIESVRYEYVSYKAVYDRGEVPKKKELIDKSAKERMRVFGKKDEGIAAKSESDEDGLYFADPNTELTPELAEELLNLAGGTEPESE